MATQFEIDCALMAGLAYQSTRDKINWFPAPSGWVEFSHVPNSTYPTSLSFEASAFQNAATGEIVISFAGTVQLTDWIANLSLGAGFSSSQLEQAALYYLQVKEANPTATISFTGHSLGGGLAALMGVLFDKQAVTFDQAPFAEAASIAVRDDLVAYLKASGYSDSQLADLVPELLSYDPYASDTDPSLDRLHNVTGYYVQGEVLQVLQPTLGVLGFQSQLDQTSVGVGSISLHSQALLTAFVANDAFRQITFMLPELLKMVFDSALYYRDTNAKDNPERNLLEHLLRHQIGIAADPATGTAGIAADAMLDRFTTDLQKVAQDGGFTLTNAHITRTLVAFAMQFYYENPDAAVADKVLFADVTGGIRFDRTEVAANLADAKGWQLYFQNYLNTLTLEEHRIVLQLLPAATDWFIQAGSVDMEATADASKAFMVGGIGADWLGGGSEADLLIGNAGDDTLQGGKNNDTLIGGADYDTYIVNAGDGADTLLDSDGQGVVVIDGIEAKGSNGLAADNWTRHGTDSWTDLQNGIVYVLYAVGDGTQNLRISKGDASVTIRNWKPGDLGIEIGAGIPPALPVTDRTITGDLTPIDFNPTEPGVQTQTDELGNVIVSGEAMPGRADYLQDGAGNDHLLGLDGDDFLYAWRGGDNILEGGAGSDILVSKGGADRLYADDKVDDLDVARLLGDTDIGTGLKGDLLGSGDGDDIVVGSCAVQCLQLADVPSERPGRRSDARQHPIALQHLPTATAWFIQAGLLIANDKEWELAA
jgi:hypothetical protein